MVTKETESKDIEGPGDPRLAGDSQVTRRQAGSKGGETEYGVFSQSFLPGSVGFKGVLRNMRLILVFLHGPLILNATVRDKM